MTPADDYKFRTPRAAACGATWQPVKYARNERMMKKMPRRRAAFFQHNAAAARRGRPAGY
ncbi:hypothetical protein [Burkholderia singularis]|uniref:Uncharacterized protein n=1 Tax=Burkholderia singularis TaxID=1503053 RepID=A0A238H9P8_9BURK|nr:hypothetical protein [Burkholderia sp. Bp7605]AOK30689.1 hypothetical protein AQ611_15810 [Burkholderia sp. Bp7605]SMG01882.1 hypothetical protein BSIN_0782 [Burkholderia singularis]